MPGILIEEFKGAKPKKVGNFLVSILFLALGLVPRFVPAVNAPVIEWMQKLGVSPNFYIKFGWILFTALGVGGLISTFVGKALNTALVQDDKLVLRYKNKTDELPYADIAAVRDLRYKGDVYIRVISTEGAELAKISKTQLPDAYNDFSRQLQTAHSNYWLGAAFPQNMGDITLPFSKKLKMEKGQFYYKGTLVPTAALADYKPFAPLAGWNTIDAAGPALDLHIDKTAVKDGYLLLFSDEVNHRLSLVRILEALKVPLQQ